MVNKSIKKIGLLCLCFASLGLVGCFHIPDEDWLLSDKDKESETNKNENIDVVFDSFINDFNNISDQRNELKNTEDNDEGNEGLDAELDEDENNENEYENIFEEVWFRNGITENGLDEEIFLQSLDQEILEDIANKLQSLIDEEYKEEQENPSILFSEGWIRVFNKTQYKEILEIGESALKPLYRILYNSEENGLYEYLCAVAIQDISGVKFLDENGSQGWSNAKEYLKLFTQEILEDKE